MDNTTLSGYCSPILHAPALDCQPPFYYSLNQNSDSLIKINNTGDTAWKAATLFSIRSLLLNADCIFATGLNGNYNCDMAGCSGELDPYICRINLDGTVPWNINLEPLAYDQYISYTSCFFFDNLGNPSLIGVSDNLNFSTSNYSIYLKRINQSGSIISDIKYQPKGFETEYLEVHTIKLIGQTVHLLIKNDNVYYYVQIAF